MDSRAVHYLCVVGVLGCKYLGILFKDRIGDTEIQKETVVPSTCSVRGSPLEYTPKTASGRVVEILERRAVGVASGFSIRGCHSKCGTLASRVQD